MKEFNLWKQLRKKIPQPKIEIVPDDENDAKVAAQLSAMYNHLIDSAELGMFNERNFDEEFNNGKQKLVCPR